MISVCLYFQVHQPFRLSRDFNFFRVGHGGDYFDDELNRSLVKRAAENCYLPANKILLDEIKRLKGQFRVSFSISGTALELFELYAPEVIESFKELVDTGCVEMISETYHHSLASLYDKDEFLQQILLHKQKLCELFGTKPKTFRNTELIYNNKLARVIEKAGYKAILAEGAKQVLGWRTPDYVYRPAGAENIKLLLRNSKLSNDLAFRFTHKTWDGGRLSPEVYAEAINECGADGEVVNIFLDYETFGEHYPCETGIMKFLKDFPGAVLSNSHIYFQTPAEIAETFHPMARMDIPNTVSWADAERDLTAWIGNPMQDAALEELYAMKASIKAQINDAGDIWRRLQTSDNFYHMCTKWLSDEEIHRHFSPFKSPHDAFVIFCNILSDFKMVKCK